MSHSCTAWGLVPLDAWGEVLRPAQWRNHELGSCLAEQPFIDRQAIGGMAAEDDFLDPGGHIGCRANRGNGDAGGGFERIAVDARADGGEGQRANAVLRGKLDRAAVAGRQQFGFAMIAAAPTFSIYLMHMPAMKLVASLAPIAETSILRLPFVIATTLAFCVVFSRVFEKQKSKWRKLFECLADIIVYPVRRSATGASNAERPKR